MKRLAVTGAVLLFAGVAVVHAGEERLTCPMGREYFLYTPDGPVEAGPDGTPRRLWLVVGIHGYRGDGRGAAGLAPWTARGDVVVVGPSFPDGYQGLGLESDTQLIGIFSELRERFRLHPKLFVHGFSGGAQFAHRFALAHPDLVAGCSAHSGGTWDDGLNPAATGVLFAVSCGENDTGKSMPSYPLGRLDWFRTFIERMNAGPFSFKARTWPGVGHEASPGAMRMTEECFLLATTGMHQPELTQWRAEVETIGRTIAAGRRDEARRRIKTLVTAATRPADEATTPAARSSAGRGSRHTGQAVRDGSTLPHVDEDASGWRLSPAGARALAAARAAFLTQAADELTARVEAPARRGRAPMAPTK